MQKFRSLARHFLGSLEKRLVGALTLIVALTVILQFVSQKESFAVRAESDELSAATALAESARQFEEAVNNLRMASNRGLMQEDKAAAGDNLTDAAIAIGDRLGKLRASGSDAYDLLNGSDVFSGLDRHIALIFKARVKGVESQALVRRIEATNHDMQAVAEQILARATERRERAQMRLDASIERWQTIVVAVGVVTIAVILLLALDLLLNILPALRRMHRGVERLADGDLDIEIGTFKLQELKALSGPLETFRKNAMAVRDLAFTDVATGLPNRRSFLESVGKSFAATPKATFAIMLIDIDRFKHVNDDYGHAAGDELVRLIGARMCAELGDDVLVARVGGDEFALCLKLNKGRSGNAVASELVAAMRDPFNLGEFSVAVTVSIGVLEVVPRNAADLDAIIRKADLALYASKKNGRNCATAFDENMAEERAIDRALEKDLENAFEHDQLRMVYQPIHSVDDGRPEVEALVRWKHPELGEVPPSTFIPAAERSGLMVRLGEWIIRRAISDFARWPDMDMSINLSPLQLQHEGFSTFLIECCKEHGIAPARLFLEVTESLSIERNTRALLMLNLLRNLGFRIALDDFGTGYSSLSMVKSFKFDRMKLDRSLVMDLGQDPASMAVFEAAVTMARHVGAEVVAEGISEAGLIGATTNAGCTHLQGYFYSRPIEASEVTGYFEVAGASAVRAA